MKLLLSSFGLGCDLEGLYHENLRYSYWSDDKNKLEDLPLFFAMPAISLQTVGPEFIPDYPAFLLFDEFMIDSRTFDVLTRGRHWGYNDFGDLVRALYRTGRLKIESYEEVIRPYKEIIAESVSYDIKKLGDWEPEFRELNERWLEFSTLVSKELEAKWARGETSEQEQVLLGALKKSRLGMIPTPDGLDILGNLKHWNKTIASPEREETRFIVGQYLRYVTSTITLSAVTGSVAHEWYDLEPLYFKKLRLGGHLGIFGRLRESVQARKLFTIMFPEFRPKDISKFVGLLDDKRVESLRNVVKQAATGEIDFDEEFLTRTLREILKIQVSEARQRNIVGWLTQPLGLVPWAGNVIQKAAEEVAGRWIERRLEKDVSWFFLVSSA